jgi:hypothetical protein
MHIRKHSCRPGINLKPVINAFHDFRSDVVWRPTKLSPDIEGLRVFCGKAEVSEFQLEIFIEQVVRRFDA